MVGKLTDLGLLILLAVDAYPNEVDIMQLCVCCMQYI